MSDIDWSKAPEGATHKYVALWYKQGIIKWYVWSTGQWRESTLKKFDHPHLLVPRPQQTELPEVGSECEWEGKKVRVVAYDDGFAVCYMITDHRVGGVRILYDAIRPCALKPIKSQRDRQIEAMVSVMAGKFNAIVGALMKCANLYTTPATARLSHKTTIIGSYDS